MEIQIGWISTLGFKVAGVSVGKDTTVVGLDSLNGVRESFNDLMEEIKGIDVGLLFIDLEVAPPGRTINGGKLIISFAFNLTRHIFNVDLYEISW